MQTHHQQVKFVSITPAHETQRIDNFLIRQLKGAPKSLIYKIIRKGQVRVNGGRVSAQYRLKCDDVVRVPPVKINVQSVKPEARHGAVLERCVLHEDDNLLVLNKPAGWAVHGGSGVSLGIIETLRQTRQPDFLELVHRLDKGTSGCLMLAKNRKTLIDLQAQLKQGHIQKTYLALLQGTTVKGHTVKAPLHKTHLKTGERWVRVDPDGKPAETAFRIIKRLNGVTLVEAKPITGRTHQIRVHAAFLEAPIVCDERYGERVFNRLMFQKGVKGLCLHAQRLTLNLQGKPQVFEAPSPLPLELFKD